MTEITYFSRALIFCLVHISVAAPISTNGQCQTNGAVCGPGYCCSQYGWCGSSSAHCSAGCQPAWGECWSPASSSPAPTTSSTQTTTTTTTTSVPPSTSTTAPATTRPSTSSATPTTVPPSIAPGGKIGVIRNCVAPGTVAITFDDGPYSYTSQIAQQFSQAGGRVTFFMNGQNWACIYDHAEAVKAAFDAGHQIGSHTWSHKDLATLSSAGVSSEMDRLSAAFLKILGAVPVYMRPPYGSYNDATLSTLQSLRFKVVALWDVDPGDSLGATTAQQEAAYNAASTAVPHVVIQHETSQNTAQNVVPLIIRWAQQRNLRMVTVGECLGSPAVDWYTNYVTPEARNPSWVC